MSSDNDNHEELIINKKISNREINLEEQISNEEDNQIMLSLCNSYLQNDLSDEEIMKYFNQNKISFESFCKNPYDYLTNTDLIIKINDNLYNSIVGIPYIISLLAYNKELNDSNIESLMKLKHKNIFSINKKKISMKNIKLEKKFQRTIKPDSLILEDFNLNMGYNSIEFRVKGNLEEIISLKSEIYLYDENVKFFVSDVDGTVTKSDVLGFFMPIVGQDWTHDNIAELFTNVHKNGYLPIYLSARNIGFTDITRKYLNLIDQNGFKMPKGPILTAPENFYKTIKREVILKTPDVFKASVLRNILQISNQNCIIAGFGNKDTDAIAYRAIGIDKSNIYTIDPSGNIHLMNTKEITSYKKINELVDQVFPKLNKIEEKEFSSYNFWNADKKIEDLEKELENLI